MGSKAKRTVLKDETVLIEYQADGKITESCNYKELILNEKADIRMIKAVSVAGVRLEGRFETSCV